MQIELNKTYKGNSLEILKKFPDQHFNCCITSPPYYGLRSYGTEPQIWDEENVCIHEWGTKGMFCKKCLAWKGELGLEPTPELYLKHLKDIFREVYRVLKPEGTLFVNIGDANKDKGQLQLPERFSIMLTDELKFIRRRRIVWYKPGIMPTSQKDNFTLDYEDVFFFVKQKKYYFEQQFEQAEYDGRKDTMFKGSKKYNNPEITPDGSVNTFAKEGHERWTEVNGIKMRNMRSVWRIPSESLKEEHYATYPQKLVERIIKAGCPEEVCNKCSQPKQKLYKGTGKNTMNIRVRDVKENRIKHSDRVASEKEIENYKEHFDGERIEETKQCDCNAGFHPGIVLDPFMGSGTTGIVARKLNRNYVGIDLQYHTINEDRTHKELGFFR